MGFLGFWLFGSCFFGLWSFYFFGVSCIFVVLTFFGLFLLVLAFFILISTTFFIAIREKNEIKKIISVGFGSWIFFQTVINLGGAVGLLPITGIVLPFVSYGGSFLLSSFIMIGIIINFSREENY